MPKTAKLITLTMLYHIQQNHHPVAATARDIALTSGRHRVPLLARLRKLTRAGWLHSQQQRRTHPECVSYEVSVFWLSEAGLTLLRDNQHLVDQLEILKPYEPETDDPMHQPGITNQFAGKASIFNMGAGI